MADLNPIEVQVMEVLENYPELLQQIADSADGEKSIYIGHGSDRNVRYPSLHLEYREFGSNEILPAGYAQLCFHAHFSKDDSSPYSKWATIRKLLEDKFARNKNQPLTEIDFDDNEGTRVVAINRALSDFGYNKMEDKYIGRIHYDIVKSEDEDFSQDFTGWCNGS